MTGGWRKAEKKLDVADWAHSSQFELSLLGIADHFDSFVLFMLKMYVELNCC